MRYLVDTNVLSDARRDPRSPAGRWLMRQFEQDVALSSVTIFELERGIRRVERRDPVQASKLRDWLDDAVARVFEDRILAVDVSVARLAARLHVPDPMPMGDSLIAATAMVRALTVVTRNARDFKRTGVPVLDPWAIDR